MGDAVFANFIVVGAALQAGWLPVGAPALQRAVELNGVQVERNLQALNIGRLWVHDRAALEQAFVPPPAPRAQTIDEVIAHRGALLTAYQDTAYASRYQRLVERVRAAERRAVGAGGAGDDGGDGAFSLAVAKGFAKLMAYKDEYEVARLYSDPAFKASLAAEFDDVRELRLNLAPPLLSAIDRDSGRPKKREFGPWIFSLLRVLARLRKLRGTAFDVFGRSEERRAERALIDAYEHRIGALLPGLGSAQLPLAARIAEVAEQIRGFGPVKAQQMKLAAAAWTALDREWAAAGVPAAPLAQAA